MKTTDQHTTAVQPKKNKNFFGKEASGDFFQSRRSNSSFFPAGSTQESALRPRRAAGPIQARLKVGQPGDPYEKEADQVAGKVVDNLGKSPELQTKALPPITPLRHTDPVQEKCASCEKEEPLQKEEKEKPKKKVRRKAAVAAEGAPAENGSPDNGSVQLKPIFESKADPPDESLQTKEAGAASAATAAAQSNSAPSGARARPASTAASSSGNLEARLSTSKSGGESMSKEVKTPMEKAFGADFSNVRIHSGTEAQQMSSDLGAKAFTTGNHIYFGAGQLNTSSPEGKSLLAHELTHTIQQGASTRPGNVQRQSTDSPATTNPATAAPTSAATIPVTTAAPAPVSNGISHTNTDGDLVQRGLLDSVASAIGGAWDATGGRLVDAAGNVIEMGEDFFWNLLSKASPEVVAIIRKIADVGIVGFLKEEVKKAVGHIFDGLTDQSGLLGQLSPEFANLLLQAKTIVTALHAGDCKPLFAALDQLKVTLTELAGEVWTKITNFFAPIAEFFEGLWTSIGAPFVDWIKKTAGDVWDGIVAIGKAIWDETAPVRDALAAAWDWLKRKLGIDSDETGEEGLIQWIERKASEAWDALKAELEPIIAPIRTMVGYVKELIPLDAILHLRETIDGWLDEAIAMGNTMGDDGKGVGSAKQQISLREQILPAILDFIGKLRLRLIDAGAWVAAKIGSIGQSVLSFFDSLAGNSLLSSFSGVINWLREEAEKLMQWAQTAVQNVFTALGDAMVYLSKFVRPILDVLIKIIDVLGDLLGKMPDLIMGPVWWALPDCIKDPIKQFFLQQILGRMPFFKKLMELGDVWDKLENAALTALKQVFVDGNLAGAIWTFFSTMLDILKIPPKLIAGIIKKGAKVLKDILNAPLDFLVNFLRALKSGFSRFFDHIWTHLVNGMVSWLTGKLEGSGIQIPKNFTLKEIFQFVCSVLDITLDKILDKIEKATGKKGLKAKIQRAIAIGSKALGWLADLFKDGPAGIWDNLAKQIGNLWDMILNGVAAWIEKTIIGEAIKWVAEKLDPTGIMAVITSIIDFFNVLTGIANQARQLLEIVDHVIDGIDDIIKGIIEKAAAFMEIVLADAIPVVLTLLEYLFSLPDVGEEVKEVVNTLREKVDEGIDWLIKEAKDLIDSLFGSGDDSDDVKEKARQKLLEKIGEQTTLEELDAAIKEVESLLQAEGLKRLWRDKNDDGDIIIEAEASPIEDLFKLVSSLTKIRPSVVCAVRITMDRQAYITANISEKDYGNGVKRDVVAGDNGFAAGTLGSTQYPKRYPDKSKAGTDLDYASIAGQEQRASGRPGGAVLLPQPGSNTLELMTWNNGPMDPKANICHNQTHAETQFISWFQSQPKSWQDAVTDIEVSLNVSPCTFCCVDLKRFIDGLGGKIHGKITWKEVYQTSGKCQELSSTPESLGSLSPWSTSGPTGEGEKAAATDKMQVVT